MSKSHILHNAQKINDLDKEIKLQEKNSSAWQKAIKAYHDSYDSLAFPGGLQKALILLKQQDNATIEQAIEFLQVDPYFFRSGYIKQKISRLLKKAPLSTKQIQSLQEMLIASLQKKTQREFVEYCRLAKAICTPSFKERIQALAQDQNPEIKKRAKQMLAIVNQ